MLKINSLYGLFAALKDEQSCIEYLEWIQWGDGNVISPFDPSSKIYKCKGNKYKCKNTGKYFTAKTNTIFQHSPVPLLKWFMAIWIMMSHRKGISSVQLGKDIGVTQKTAWFMLQKIRANFSFENDYELEGTVEIDETFIGGKNKNRHKDKKVEKCQGRSYKDKTPVFGMLQRGNKVIAKVVEDTKAKTLRKEINKTVKKGSTIYSDEWNYGNLNKDYFHDFIQHCFGIYGKDDVYTNGIESFWAIIKRGIIGIYHKVSKDYMQRYIDEFVFRYNTRKILPQNLLEHIIVSSYPITYKQILDYGKE